MIICFTGHRPKYLPGGWDNCESTDWFSEVMSDLKEKLQEYSPTHVISGLCSGWDIWAGEAALELNIPVHAYVPFPGQGNNWSKNWQKRRNDLEKNSSVVKVLSEKYSNAAFYIRDKAMVDNADVVFSLLHPDATNSGTAITVRYAESNGKKVVPFWR